MIPFINPWIFHILDDEDEDMPVLCDVSFESDKEYLRGQGILVFICDIVTAVVAYMLYKIDMYPLGFIIVGIFGIPILIFTFLWFKDLIKYIKENKSKKND